MIPWGTKLSIYKVYWGWELRLQSNLNDDREHFAYALHGGIRATSLVTSVNMYAYFQWLPQKNNDIFFSHWFTLQEHRSGAFNSERDHKLTLLRQTNWGILHRIPNLSVKGCLGSKNICEIWNSERNQHCWKLLSASVICSY